MIHQPPNTKLLTKNLDIELNWNATFAGKLNTALHQAQITIDSDAQMYSMKYTRRQTGALIDSTELHTTLGSGMIIQSTPYAKEVYYGGGRVNLSANPDARRRWFESVIANHKDAILKHAQEVLNKELGN